MPARGSAEHPLIDCCSHITMKPPIPLNEVSRLVAKFCGPKKLVEHPVSTKSPDPLGIRNEIIEALRKNPGIETSKLAESLGRHVTTVRRHLHELWATRKVKRTVKEVGIYKHQMHEWELVEEETK